jgi:hypothetical protein
MALKNNKNTNKRKLQRKQKKYHATKNLATQIKKTERKQKILTTQTKILTTQTKNIDNANKKY